MSIFDAINAAESGMNVARYRSEVASNNIANIFTPGYQWQDVNLAAVRARPYSSGGGPTGAGKAVEGAVRVTGTSRRETSNDYRSQAMDGIVEMYESKTAYEINMRAATLLKSMALGALEIGRGA